MIVVKDIAGLKASVGQSATTETPFEVTQELVNLFAEATKDYQWIHTDPERAKRESPFGGPIAHGFFSLSLLPKMMEGILKVESARMGVNYGVNKVRFPAPVPVGSKLSCHCTIKDVEDHAMGGVKITWACTITIDGGGDKPVCVAEMLSLLFE